MGKTREFLTQDAGTAIDRINEPIERFALKRPAFYWLVIAAVYAGAWFYAGWRAVLFVVVAGVVIGLIGNAWSRRAARAR